MIVAIVQARMGSRRLPGKTLMPFGHTTVLGYLLERIKSSNYVDKIVVATTNLADDDAIHSEAVKHNCHVYRGSSRNVLSRFYGAATKFNADVIVRLTADDPFKCPKIVDAAIEMLVEDQLNYVSNTIKPSYPEGFDVEVFTYHTLQLAFQNAKIERHLEHVTPYIYENSENFKIGHLTSDIDYSSLRMTIDYLTDYKVLYDIAKNVDHHIAGDDLIEYVSKKNLSVIIQSDIERNQGYNEQLNAKN